MIAQRPNLHRLRATAELCDGLLTVRLPLPPACLHPNARPHWTTKAKATRAFREIARLAARSVWNASPASVVTYSLAYSMPRRRDGDGLVSWAKAARDGIADAISAGNDTGWRLAGEPEQTTGAAASVWELVIVIRS